MQTEFDLHYPTSKIEILGINQKGFEIGNGSITDGRDIPWLQDVDSDADGQSDVWLNSWPYEYRDVAIVDDDGGYQETYGLTKNDLGVTTNYDALKEKFFAVVNFEPKNRWQAPIEPLDVDSSSRITPLDALHVINQLGQHDGGVLPQLGEVDHYVDTDGDGRVGPLDALLVINQLNVIAAASAASAAAPQPALAQSAVPAQSPAQVHIDEPTEELHKFASVRDAVEPVDFPDLKTLELQQPSSKRRVSLSTDVQTTERDEVFADLAHNWAAL